MSDGSIQSRLYWGYKHLVAAVQASCSASTRPFVAIKSVHVVPLFVAYRLL